MELLLIFVLIAVIWGMASRSIDWRHYFVLLSGAAIVAFIYQVSPGVW